MARRPPASSPTFHTRAEVTWVAAYAAQAATIQGQLTPVKLSRSRDGSAAFMTPHAVRASTMIATLAISGRRRRGSASRAR